MNLFIDGVSKTSVLILFNDNRKILSKEEFNIKWNESSNLLPHIDNFLKKYNYKYIDLENIIVVNWPWSFTWIRNIVLSINTINYIIWKNITAISYFDLFDNFPIIKPSSKRDYFIKKTKNDEIEIIDNSNLLELLNNLNINKVYWELNEEIFTQFKILDKINYFTIIKKIELKNNKKIQALYIKKPSIS